MGAERPEEEPAEQQNAAMLPIQRPDARSQGQEEGYPPQQAGHLHEFR